MDVTWKTNIWKNEYRLFRGKLIVGLLKRNTWNNDAYGEFNGSLLRFKSLGFWKAKTQIRDIEDQRTLGHITYNLWKGTAIIEYEAQEYLCTFSHWKHNNWSVRAGAESAEYRMNFWHSKGEIQIEYLPDALVLAGLYAQSYYGVLSMA